MSDPDPFSRAGLFEQRRRDAEQQRTVESVAKRLGATRAEGVVPGLWNLPGYPELTTGQLMSLDRNPE